MESEDIGYEFHGDFTAFLLNARNTAASSATDKLISLVKSLSDTLNKLIVNENDFSEANKSDLETQYEYNEGSASRIENEAHHKQ